jgi:hypothetical protein
MVNTVIKLFRSVRAPLVLAATLLFCVTIHEIGHVLATLATGGRIKSISILSLQPHVRVQGNFTETQRAIRSVAGSATVLALWVAFVLILPRGYPGLIEVRATTAFFAFIEVLGWTLSCLIYPGGPRSNDSWKFIEASGADPAIMTAICLIFMAGIGLLYRNRTMVSASRPRKWYPQNVSILTTINHPVEPAVGTAISSDCRVNDLAA